MSMKIFTAVRHANDTALSTCWVSGFLLHVLGLSLRQRGASAVIRKSGGYVSRSKQHWHSACQVCFKSFRLAET